MLRYLLIAVLVVFAYSEPIKDASTNYGGLCICRNGNTGYLHRGFRCLPGSDNCHGMMPLFGRRPPYLVTVPRRYPSISTRRMPSVCCTPSYYRG